MSPGLGWRRKGRFLWRCHASVCVFVSTRLQPSASPPRTQPDLTLPPLFKHSERTPPDTHMRTHLLSTAPAPQESPHYVKARMAMADIYLRHRKDKAAYIKCYMDLVVRGGGREGGREGGRNNYTW